MYNQITLIGNLGGDPELRFTPSGVAVASFSLAVSKTWNNEQGKQSKTIWVRCSAWRKQAEIIAEHLTKGSKVMVVGELEEARAFTDKSGNNRASLEVTIHVCKFLSGKGEGNEVQADGGGEDEATSIPF